MKAWAKDRITNALFGLMTALLMVEIALDSIWGMVFVGFLWGWNLVTTIQICLIEEDTRKLTRQNEWLKGVNDARQRQPMPLFTMRPPDTLL